MMLEPLFITSDLIMLCYGVVGKERLLRSGSLPIWDLPRSRSFLRPPFNAFGGKRGFSRVVPKRGENETGCLLMRFRSFVVPVSQRRRAFWERLICGELLRQDARGYGRE